MKATKMRIYPMIIQQNKPQKRGHMHLFEKTIDSEVKYEGKILTVCSDKAELENGAIVSRDVIRHSGGVALFPLLMREMSCL